MKILMINSVCGIRSTGRICTDIADELTKQGHQVKIAYGRETVPEKYQKYAVRIGSDLSVKVDALTTRILDNAGFNSKAVTKRFLEWVRKYDPDVIHLHNIHGYYINLPLLFEYLAKSNKKVIWTLHDCWSFTGHCAYFTYAKCDRWKKGCHDCPCKKEYPASLKHDRSELNWKQKRKMFTSVKDMTIVTPSKWLAGLVKRSYLKKYPVVVINNGIDTSIFKPTQSDFREKHGLEGKKIILGVASVWDRRKGLEDFIKLSKMIDDHYAIVLVGLSEKQIKQMPKNIICISRTNSQQELAEIYSAADVFLNPSYEETMGLVSVEALACGTPVVSSDCTALPEFVLPETGAVFHERDGFLIYHEIRKVISKNYDSLRLFKMSQCYEKILKYKEYLNLYENIYCADDI